jgi:hypothetical protein
MITERIVSKKPGGRTSRPLSGRAVVRRKLRVDEAHRLDLADLRRAGAFDLSKGGRVWISKASLGLAGPPSEIAYVMVDQPDRRSVFLGDKRGPGSPEARIYEVQLTTTRCHFGGWRWWFSCPLVVRGVPCNRRCRILYRPLGAPYFGCRECWRLTYRCRQLHRDLAYEGPGRASELMDEMSQHWRRFRSHRKAWNRFQRLARANQATQRFLARTEARLARAPR